MGLRNSSETRVRPVFNELLDRWPDGAPWLAEMCALASKRCDGVVDFSDMGRLLPSESPHVRQARLGTVFERTIAPPGRFLSWLLQHPEEMEVADPIHFGASSPIARKWRRQLFSKDPGERAGAQREGLTRLLQHGANNSRHEWWAFEGFTHTDCCLVTDTWVLLVEGKRTETVSPSTRWFKNRSQLWRNVESAQSFTGQKQFGVILGVESEADGISALDESLSTLDGSLPHLSNQERKDLSRHLLGFVTWAELVQRFGLSTNCLPDTLDDIEANKTPAGLFAGVDGCPGGWVVATSDVLGKSIDFTLTESIDGLLENGALGFVAIDIPIGLPASGSRSCDIAARKALGPGQGSRVFPAPSRSALDGVTYQEACALNIAASGKAISKQAHAIIPKIKQVDAMMTPLLQARVREVHPEVSFCVINRRPLKYSKATREGHAERLAILKANDLNFDPVAERRRLGAANVAIDDLLDAAVALLTARRVYDGVALALGDNELDARGLRMEIVA